MITGSNDVYTPVDAYGVATYADSGIISGGNSGSETVVGSTRFLWVYDPSVPYESPSGFTGKGWFSNITYSPIGYYLSQNSEMTLEKLIDQFKSETGTRTDLNDVFSLWQSYVNSNPEGNYVSRFAISNINDVSCVIMNM